MNNLYSKPPCRGLKEWWVCVLWSSPNVGQGQLPKKMKIRRMHDHHSNSPRVDRSFSFCWADHSRWSPLLAAQKCLLMSEKLGLKIFLASTLTNHHHLRSRPTHSSVTEASISKPHRRPLRDAKGASISRSHHHLHSRRSRQCTRAGSTSMTLHHLRKPLQGKFSGICMSLDQVSKKKVSVQKAENKLVVTNERTHCRWCVKKASAQVIFSR